MKKFLYAAYGSNLHPVRISERLESPTLVGTSHIDDRGFRFNKKSKDGSGKGNIIQAKEGVYVAIYELHEHEKAKLDQIEGLGSGYYEETLRVPDFGNCFTYVAEKSAVDDALLPYSWYKNLVLLGCNYHRFPGDYVAQISESFESVDPDSERNASSIQLVERIKYGL